MSKPKATVSKSSSKTLHEIWACTKKSSGSNQRNGIVHANSSSNECNINREVNVQRLPENVLTDCTNVVLITQSKNYVEYELNEFLPTTPIKEERKEKRKENPSPISISDPDGDVHVEDSQSSGNCSLTCFENFIVI